MTTSHTSFLVTLLALLLAPLDSTEAHPSKRDTLPNETRAPPPNLSAYSPVLTDGETTSNPQPQPRTLTIPGSASLPSPTGTLKYITLGRGTQNYTCASPTSTPVPIGAAAALFDVAQLLTAASVAKNQATLNTLPNTLIGDTVAQIAESGLPFIGGHYFTAGGVPTWNLLGDGLLYGASVGDIPAPLGANAGPQGYGAVDWKALTGVAGSVGLTEVYRVETAGGEAPASCSGGLGATIQIQYAATYWFYE